MTVAYKLKADKIINFLKERNLTKERFCELCQIHPHELDFIMNNKVSLSGGFYIQEIAASMGVEAKSICELCAD